MWRTIRHLMEHPLNRTNRLAAIMRFFRWQMVARIMPYPHVVPFVDDTVLVMEKGMTGATGNWYSGLHESADMAFVLHLLRGGDVFADIGANVGSYTILAAGCCRSKVVSVEPIPGTFSKLERNVAVNRLSDLVTCHNIGAGSEEGTLRFTADSDTKNHVVSEAEAKGTKTLDVPVRRLDDVLSGATPRLMKIDVEGWESEVLKGMPQILADPTLVAIVTETNDFADRYQSDGQSEVAQIMAQAGFVPCSYDPFAREVRQGGTHQNTIFVRDLALVQERVKTARRFTLINGEI
ncbi:FkbM family methyltransferase [Tropicibacter sp. R15_0]|uniref:FkbM family methyltransferase n=1 Tax=Tropicibacter sp. R15_0 TaxID=2821101 RepID=UPI001AD9F053|nr:FkbM family methyltransferase [Tropicibacter sp. R15_0]MBO9467529.1 FkbM family methyltransferase [Tropicibacter sp. R15_0]